MPNKRVIGWAAAMLAGAVLGASGIGFALASQNESEASNVSNISEIATGAVTAETIAETTEATADTETASTETTATTADVRTGKRSVDLNVLSSTPVGDFVFVRAEINYDYKGLIFRCKYPDPTAAPTSTGGDRITANLVSGSTCTAKNGEALTLTGYGGVVDGLTGLYFEFPEGADLSHVTVTYCLDSIDPVTVTIDIPGL